MALFLGLLAALGWGVGDFLARFNGRALGVPRTMLVHMAIGTVVLGAWLAAVPSVGLHRAASAGIGAWIAGVASVPPLLAASVLMVLALTRGTLGVVSPIASSYGAVTTLVAVAAGEAISAVALAGVALAVAGVALVSSTGRAPARNPREAPSRRGIGLAAGAALCFGVGFWVQGRWAVPGLGAVLPVWLFFAGGLLLYGITAAFRPAMLAPPGARQGAVLLCSVGLGLGAYVAFAIGLDTGQVAVVTVLSSLATGVTALLARMFLGERLAPPQWVGVASILAGIALLDGG